MADRISHTTHDDAPLSSARHPDARAAAPDIHAEEGDTLLAHTVCINRPRSELYAFWRDFRVDVAAGSGCTQQRSGAVPGCTEWPRYLRHGHDRVRPARGWSRTVGCEVVPPRAEDPGATGPASVQAADGNRGNPDGATTGCRAPRLAYTFEEQFMRALTWHGKHDVRIKQVADPQIINPRDAIIKM